MTKPNLGTSAEKFDPKVSDRLLSIYEDRSRVRIETLFHFLPGVLELNTQERENINKYLDVKGIADEIQNQTKQSEVFHTILNDFALDFAEQQTACDSSKFSYYTKKGLFEATSEADHNLMINHITDPFCDAEEIADFRARAILMKSQIGAKETYDAITFGYVSAIAQEYMFNQQDIPPVFKMALSPEVLAEIKWNVGTPQEREESLRVFQDMISRKLADEALKQTNKGTHPKFVQKQEDVFIENLDRIETMLRDGNAEDLKKFDTIKSIHDVRTTYVDPILDFSRFEAMF